MPKARGTIRKPSGSTEIPFAPLIFSATALPIPLEPPDTASLTAMPELVLPTVIPTNNDWREHPRWKPLIGTPSRTPVPAGTLVPDPSPAKSWSDGESDALVPPSPAGSFVHRRRRGEYAQRAPVWSIRALVEDTKGWHEMGGIDRDYSPPWSPVAASDHISYANQLDMMANVMTQQPLIVGMAIEATAGKVSLHEKDTQFPQTVSLPGDGEVRCQIETAPPKAGCLPSSYDVAAPKFPDLSSTNDAVPSQDTTAATSIDETVVPWLAAIPSRLSHEEYQHSIKRELLSSYRDLRCDNNTQIMPGAVVVCIEATRFQEEDRGDQFKPIFGGLYRVLQIFGDTWAFCQKLSARPPLFAKDLEVPSLPASNPGDRSHKKVFGAKKDLRFVLVQPNECMNFLPLCAVTLWENLEDYCLRAQIGPGFPASSDAPVSAPGTFISSQHGSATAIEGLGARKSPPEGGLVKAAPRFSSLKSKGNQYRLNDGVLVADKIYKEYLRHYSVAKPHRVQKDPESVRTAFEEQEAPQGSLSGLDGCTTSNGRQASMTNGRRGTLKIRGLFRKENSEGLAVRIEERQVELATSENVVPPGVDSGRLATAGTSPKHMHVEQAGANPSPPVEDAMSGDTDGDTHHSTWKRITVATQRLGTQGRDMVKDYFAPPDWVVKSPYQVRTLF